jgi:hypothetical protein
MLPFTSEEQQMALKGKLLDSAAAVTKSSAKPKTKGKSKVETEIERQNRGNKPEAVVQKPRGARAESAPHEHHHRHGDRGDDADGSEDDGESLAGDVLRGAEAIAAFVNLDVRQAFHGLQKGYIPAVKEGSTWVSTKSRLRRHYNEERYQPPPKELPPDPVGQARCAEGGA